MESLQVYPIHEQKQYINECCDLINSEWPRGVTARLRTLSLSCSKFPTSLVMILNEKLVGHVKLSELKLGGPDIIIESMVIHREHRGKGWGRILMHEAEEFCRRRNKKILYLSTRGQEGFYKKLGFEYCEPVLFFGYCDISPQLLSDVEIKEIEKKKEEKTAINYPYAPVPPPLPEENNPGIKNCRKSCKIFMCKSIV